MIRRSLKRVVDLLLARQRLEDLSRATAVEQKILISQYRLLADRDPKALPPLFEAGFKCRSQFEEDGILLLLFSLLPTGNRRCLEIGCGNGRECMTANLILNHGWWGWLFDGCRKNVADANEFFKSHGSTWLFPPRISQGFFSVDNVNDLVRKANVPQEIELLSLDIDGMDYWVWEALDAVDPLVVVIETNNIMSADKKLVAPYVADFVHDGTDFFGASLAAMASLATRKGYRLVGTHRYGFNAFFVKRGVGEEFFPEVTVDSCLGDPYSAHARQFRWPAVAARPWVQVA